MILGFDKFEENYIKVIGDFNKVNCTVFFNHGTIQKIDDDYYWLLCYATNVVGLTFKYEPTKDRFPENAAILLKLNDYKVNLKNKDGKWDNVIFTPSPLEKWLISHFNHQSHFFFDPFEQFSGFMNLSNITFEALPKVDPTVPINSTGIMNVVKASNNIDLPDCELKRAAEKGKGNNSQQPKNHGQLSVDKAFNLYQEAIDLAGQTYATVKNVKSGFVTEKDEINLRLAIFNWLLQNR